MALARVVTFDQIQADNVDRIKERIEGGEPPEGFPEGAEIVVLHEEGADRALVIVFVESDDDYRRADEILAALPSDGTPGRRTSVTRYQVVVRARS